MTKRKSGKPAKRKEVKALQVWELNETQKAILLNAKDRHVEECLTLRKYQDHEIMGILREVKKELGILTEMDVRFNGKAMTLTEVPPQPRKSPTTQDLTKVPTS